MLSPFSSALTKLDDSLETIQVQFERVRAGLEANEDALRMGLVDACHYATILSDLISAQRAGANEIDHESLDQLIHELKILRCTEGGRLKLLNLASELSVGRVHHHRVNRTEELNKLRLRAVKELRGMAARSSQEKKLPGPRSSKWLHWACGLQEENDAALLQNLRRDFPGLEEFIAAIDERYWVSGNNHSTEFSSALAEGAAEEFAAELPPVPATEASSGDQDRLARNLLAMFEKVLHAEAAQAPSASNSSPPVAMTRDVGTSGAERADSSQGLAQSGRSPLVPARGKLDKERIDKAASLEFMKVVTAWQLSDSQARRLLGISRTLFDHIRDGERMTLEPDKLTRISLLVAIAKGLNVLYGSRRGEKWVHRPNSNPLFDGTEPLKYMLKEGVEGLLKVRELVGVWSGYISPEETQ